MSTLACIPPGASIDPLAPINDTALGNSDDVVNTDEETDEPDTNDPSDTEDIEDTEDTEGADDGTLNNADFMGGDHLVFKNGLFLHYEVPLTSGSPISNALGGDLFPFLDPDQDWAFGFKWAPDSEDASNHMFGVESEPDSHGEEMALFQVSNNFLTIQFMPTDSNQYVPLLRFITMNNGNICRSKEFGEANNEEFLAMSVDRNALESGFRLFTALETNIENNELDAFSTDKFILGIKPNGGEVHTFNLEFINLSQGLNCVTNDGVIVTEFGKRDSLIDEEGENREFASLVGRVDDLIIFHILNTQWSVDYSETNESFFNTANLADLANSDDDDLFMWNFSPNDLDDNGTYDYESVADVSASPSNGPETIFNLKIAEDSANFSTLDSNEAEQFYDN